jgi:RNA polymerase sigma factor (sigma-70 family)
MAITNPAPRDSVAVLGDRLVAHRNDALRAARALVGRQDAEDVVQEATARVLGAAARGAVIEQPAAYLRAAVRRTAIDHLTARRLERSATSSRETTPERLPGGLDPHQAVEIRAVFDAIGELPAKQRHALLGTVLTDRDQTDLATILQTTPAGVRQLVRRARVGLRKTLGGWIPWLTGRGHELITAIATGGTPHGEAIALATAAAIAWPLPTPPAIKTPPPPRPVTITRPAPAGRHPPRQLTIRHHVPVIRRPANPIAGLKAPRAFVQQPPTP